MVNILGTEYEVVNWEELNDCDGLCDWSTRKLKVCKTLYEASKEGELQNKRRHAEKVLRHEVIHAFLHESGLRECANWDTEQMVDYFASQFPKMLKVFEGLGIQKDNFKLDQ